MLVLSAVADEANPAHAPLTALLASFGTASRDLALSACRGLLLLLASFLTWLGRLVVQIVTAVISTVAELTGASALLASLTVRAALATADTSAALAALQTAAITNLHAMLQSVLRSLTVVGYITVFVLVARSRLRARRVGIEARHYIAGHAWLLMRLKAPLGQVQLAPTVDAASAAGAAEDDRERLQDLDDFRHRIVTLTSEFISASLASADAGAADRATLLGRYCALAADAAGLPSLSHAALHARRVSFRYGDAWRWPWDEPQWPWGMLWSWEGRHASHASSDMSYDLAASLHNLAASLSQHAATLPLEARCRTFQQAAGVLEALAELAASARWAGLATADMRADSLDAMRAIMLAQAQRCVYDKAAERGCTAQTMETLASETAALYAAAASSVRSAVGAPGASLSASLARDWSAVPQCCALLFESLAQTHAASTHAAAAQYGSQVARLRHAVQQAETAARLAPPSLAHFFDGERAAVATELATAERDNGTIYFERVPALNALPACKRSRERMVRALPPPWLARAGASPGEGLLADVFGSPAASSSRSSRRMSGASQG